jgi:hypothetical protein
MQKLVALLSFIFIFSCGSDSNNLTVKGNIKGLKKGTVYLQKVKDTSLVIVDSLVINGEPNFELSSSIDEPEVFFLILDKNDSKEERISFFADKGITEINTTRKRFAFDAKINGTKQQAILNKYRAMMRKFNNKNLDLIKEEWDALKDNDTALANKKKKSSSSLLKRKYLFTTNFAITNKDSEVAPYLAITELYNANIKLLDTINTSLSPKVKTSLYGKKLQDFISKIKNKEK